MPQRFLRPGIRNSERWNSVSWAAQSFYLRIITLVDDYGRYDGRDYVLLGECFSAWNALNPENAVSLQQVAEMSQQLAADSVQLLDLYEVEGKKVLQVTQWQERIREGAKEKWPSNPNPQRSAANRSVPLPPSSPPPPSPTPTPSVTARAVTLPNSELKTATAPAGDGTCVRVDLKAILPDKSVRQDGVGVLELISQLNSFYRRPDDFRWSCEEEHLAAEVARRPSWSDELKLIQWYKSKLPEKRFFPQTIVKLLSGWTAHLDKARGAQHHKSMRGE